MGMPNYSATQQRKRLRLAEKVINLINHNDKAPRGGGIADTRQKNVAVTPN